MKKQFKRFTLVEMLTVVAIISILAALVIPTVIIAQNRGRVTQAKSDIASIITAMKQLKSDYNRILLSDGTINGTKASLSDSDTLATISGDAYDVFIAEISAPKTSGLGTTAQTRINKRKKVYLDPKNGFDPTKNYDNAANAEKLWRDPWGNAYVIYVKLKDTHQLAIPDTGTDEKRITIASDMAVYSFGPNGEDDKGCNVELDACIKNDKDDDSDYHKNHDDIASWNL